MMNICEMYPRQCKQQGEQWAEIHKIENDILGTDLKIIKTEYTQRMQLMTYSDR